MSILNEIEKYFKDKEVFVDMDGVLTDFDKHFETLGFGTVEEAEEETHKRVWRLVKDHGNKEFWSKMPWIHNGKKLWDIVKQYNPTILSSPIKDKSCYEGKREWVERELGPRVKVILRSDKESLAHPNALLIDDRSKNIINWKLKGGVGIKHKDNDLESTINQLKKFIEE